MNNIPNDPPDRWTRLFAELAMRDDDSLDAVLYVAQQVAQLHDLETMLVIGHAVHDIKTVSAVEQRQRALLMHDITKLPAAALDDAETAIQGLTDGSCRSIDED